MNTLEASRALNVIQDRILKDAVGEKEFVDARESAKREIDIALYGGVDVHGTSGSASRQESFFGDALMDGIEYDSDGKPRPAGLVVNRAHDAPPVDDVFIEIPGLEPPVG